MAIPKDGTSTTSLCGVRPVIEVLNQIWYINKGEYEWKKTKHYLSVIIILFLCIGIGYAYLSSTLNSSFSNITVTGFDRICQRATTLHTETCTLSSGGCYAAGYSASGSKKTKR